MPLDLSNITASFICRHPGLCVIVSIIFALVCSSSLLNFTVETDIRRSFSPSNSRFNSEAQVYHDFFKLPKVTDRFLLIFRSKDQRSILSEATVSEVLNLDAEVRRQIGNYCEPFCDSNQVLQNFLEDLQQRQTVPSYQPNNLTIIDFPLSIIDGQECFLGLHVHNVTKTVNPITHKTNITYAERIFLWYFWGTEEPKIARALHKFAMDLFEMSKNESAMETVTLDFYSDSVANVEMMRGAYDATVLMSIGFFFLLAFVCSVVWHQVNRRALPVVVFTTVFSPFLAVVIAFGIISWMGFPLYMVMCVSPFLILGIGVDDAFIMLQSWSNSYCITDKQKRLASVFTEVGPSVSITSVTNTVAFALGYFTPTPEMSTFCLCTSLACLLDYILTFSLFAPILISCSTETTTKSKTALQNSISLKKLASKFYESYSKFLCSMPAKILLLFLMTAIMSSATFGVLHLKINFQPTKVFPYNSPLVQSLDAIKGLFTDFFPMLIFVNRPPNVSDPYEYQNFYNMISDLESLPYVESEEYNTVLLRTYDDFDRVIHTLNNAFGLISPAEYVPNFDNLKLFVESSNTQNYIHFSVDEQGKVHVQDFLMTLMLKYAGDWTNRSMFLDDCRKAVERYPEFNVSVYDGEAALLDFMLTVKHDTIGSVTVTVTCMAIICFLFIRNRAGVFIITCAIASICYVLTGALYWWDADLDPIIMVDVLISTGFSVDYTAHIAYKFYQCKGDAKSRVQQSFEHMFLPMSQAGLSTLLCMLPLILASTYATLSLAKTVILVIVIGLFHGFFVLPVLLSTFYISRKDSVLREKLALAAPNKSSDSLLRQTIITR